jgi:TPR repeat protein
MGATLAPMGAGTDSIERLSNGDIAGAFSQLKAQARAGDASAANQLDYIAHFICGFAALDGPQSDFQASELLDSNSLPPADGDWFRAVLKDRNAFKEQLVSNCRQSLDKNEIDAWVTAAAARGDPASEYSLWMFGGTNIRRLSDEHLRAAALGGYPWAQFTLGSRTSGETPGMITGGEASDHPGDLLRAAAQSIPAAQGQLAGCEFTGCDYIAQDIPAAVAGARAAAEQGSIDAMLAIGPLLQASQIDPDEVRAWQLIKAALQLQGYEGLNINVELIRAAAAVLNSPTVTPKARAIAEQHWHQFGAKMLSGLGCTG